MALEWPVETVLPHQGADRWFEAASNRVLDFHGDPSKAQLVVFSDGNHHMALLPAMKAFYEVNPAVADIFYATTPPGPIVAIVYYHLALRYTRIFPDRFDFVPLGGTKTHPVPHLQNRIAAIHMGLVGQGGTWGERFLEFMHSPTVADIYTRHGMRVD